MACTHAVATYPDSMPYAGNESDCASWDEVQTLTDYTAWAQIVASNFVPSTYHKNQTMQQYQAGGETQFARLNSAKTGQLQLKVQKIVNKFHDNFYSSVDYSIVSTYDYDMFFNED